MKSNQANKNTASASIAILAFSAIFTLLIAGIINLALMQHKLMKAKLLQSRAFDMAESGLEYYEWFLSRYPKNTQYGEAAPRTSYTHLVKDPESSETLGSFVLEITPSFQCGKLLSLDIKSTGKVKDEKGREYTKTLFATLAKPSVARFSYIIDSNVWAGQTREIVGPYHSNGGIRMDGTNNSLVTSAKSTWLCDSAFGCSPAQSKPGVFGSGPNSSLWKYPVDEKPFVNFASDFSLLKDLAKNQGGIYLPEFTGIYGNDRRGYELIFKNDGTVDVYKVYDATSHWGYRREYAYKYSWYYGWRRERNKISSRVFIGNYNVPNSCSLIFSEEKLWIKGTVQGKTTVVAARSQGSFYEPELVLEDNLLYKDADGSDGLTVIAQSYIIIPEYSPNYMELNGIFVAQNGSFGRSYYTANKRAKLTLNGTVVSKERVGTSWTCQPGNYFCSGYSERTNSYDRFLRNDPPPFTPSLAENMIFVKWRED